MPSGMPAAVPAATATSIQKSPFTQRSCRDGSGLLISGSTQIVAANQQIAIHRIEIYECQAREIVTGISAARSRPKRSKTWTKSLIARRPAAICTTKRIAARPKNLYAAR